MEKGAKGDVYNLASENGITNKELLDISMNIAKEHFNIGDMSYKLDQSRLRPTDLPVLIGDASKAKEQLGWNAKIPFNRTILEMIHHHINMMN